MARTIPHPFENANPRQQCILKFLPSITYVDEATFKSNKERSLVRFKEEIVHWPAQ
jgi:hypothetical protein